MAPNGAAALHAFEPTLAVAPSNGASVAASVPASEIKHKIAEAVVDAAVAMAAGVVDWGEIGVMSPPTRELNGETLGRVVMLLLDNPGELRDFGEVAFNEGRRVLLARLGTGLDHWRCGATLVDELLHGVVGIAEKVARSELAYQKRCAH